MYLLFNTYTVLAIVKTNNTNNYKVIKRYYIMSNVNNFNYN